MDHKEETIPYEAMVHNLDALREAFCKLAKETLGGTLRESTESNKSARAAIRKRHKNGGRYRVAGVSEFHGPATAVLERGTCEMIAWTFEPERVKRGLDILAAIKANEVRIVPVPPDPEGT